jgi:hypothetical protein
MDPPSITHPVNYFLQRELMAPETEVPLKFSPIHHQGTLMSP